MRPIPLKKRRFYFIFFCLIFLAAIPLILLYTNGYRINSKFEIVETGGIYIYSPQAGSDIYINNKKKDVTTIFNKDIFVQNLKPGNYKILIAKEDFWPWAKEVEVKERHVAEAIAFLIPKEPDWKIIPEYIMDDEAENDTSKKIEKNPNPGHEKILALFEEKYNSKDKLKLDTDTQKSTTTKDKIEEFSKRKRTGLWSEDAQIFAMWLSDEKYMPNYFCRGEICQNPLLVFSSTEEIKSLGFYPGREDVILLAVGIGIYALEIDSRVHQNFQPLYKGTNPIFIIEGKTLYAKDGEIIFSLSL